MMSTGMGIEKLPETGSTFSAESTTSIPWLSAIGTRFQSVGSGGKMSELVAALRIGHCRLECWSHGRTRQLHVDSEKVIGGPLPGDYSDPASNRGLGNV